MLGLPKDQTHLWWAFPDHIQDREILARQLRVLSDVELVQQRRFVFERHRHQYLVSHALVRDALSHYAPVQPKEWRFEVNEYGRPAISEPAEWRGLRFNLSHTEGRAVVAVAWDVEIGVDVESTNQRGDLADIADRFFSPLEVAQLRIRPDAFLDFWTLKEAYIKARGMGLAIPLDSFSFSLNESGHPEITFHKGCIDSPERWQFELQRGDGYRMALATAVGGGKRRPMLARTLIPMAVPVSV